MKYKLLSILILLIFIGCRGCNDRPMIVQLKAEPPYCTIKEKEIEEKKVIEVLQPVKIICETNDPDKDKLTYVWKYNDGKGIANGNILEWQANTVGIYKIEIEVSDGKLTVDDYIYIEVINEIQGKGHTVIKGGEMSGVLTKEKGPYLLMGDLIVPTGKTLVIEPGTEIIFKSLEDNTYSGEYYDLSELRVYGTLIAKGTNEKDKEEYIIFSASPKYDPKDGKKIANCGNDWAGIKFYPSSKNSVLSYCLIQYGSWNITCEKSSPIIENSIIRLCGRYDEEGGIYLDQSNAIIKGNYINGTGGGTAIINPDFNGGNGIFCKNSNPQILGNYIGEYSNTKIPTKFQITLTNASRNAIGINCQDNSTPQIDYNTLSNNIHQGILCKNSSPIISHNHIEGDFYAIFCENSNAQIEENNLISNQLYAIVATIDKLYYKIPSISNCYISAPITSSPWLNVNPLNIKDTKITNIGADFFEK